MIRIPSAAFFYPILVACLCLAACVLDRGTDASTCVADCRTDSAASAQAHWKRSQPARYSYTLEQKTVWISWKVRVSAVRDSVIEVHYAEAPVNDIPLDENPQSYSIDSLIAEIGLASKGDPGGVHTTYNATYGFPESVHFDGLPDTQATKTITGFQVESAP